MRHVHLLPLSLTALGLVVGPRAHAEDPPPPKEAQFFEQLDADRDGKVTLAEFRAAGKDEASFALLDVNKDEAVTPDELGLPVDYKPAPRAKPPAPPPGGGQPGQGGGEMRRRLKEMDKDGDGRIAREEWTGEAAGFDRFDRNKDGFLDAQDNPPGQGKRPGMGGGPAIDPAAIKQRWLKMDKDGDQKISRDEYTGEFQFERLDTDKDGFLTDVDLKALVEAANARQGQGQGQGQPPMGPGGPGGQGGPGGMPGGMPEPSPEQIAKQFASMDKDGNGRLEPAELPEGPRERMLKADTNGDGALDVEEFTAGAKKARRPQGPGAPQGPGGPGAPQGPGMPGGPNAPGGPGAPGGGPPGIDILKRFDHDRDGTVTRDQFPGGDEQFARLDKNGDGVLTAADFPPPPAPGGAGGVQPGAPVPADGPAKPDFARLDKDGDGKLCRPEWPGTDAEWRALDKDTDGWVTPQELGAR